MKNLIFTIFLFLTVGLLILTPSTVNAQEKTLTTEEILQMSYEDLYNLPLEQLMQLADIVGVSADELLSMILSREIRISSKEKETMRDAAGIVSVISADEIKKTGARDLMDVLSLVPGFSPSFEVVGTYWLGVRGIMGQSRVILLIDGQAINELMYNTVELNNHFSLDQIRQIEIIRGPGSSVYGGNAVLSVINIVTKSGEEMNGASVGLSYSQMEKTYGRQNATLSAGTKAKDLDISLHSFIGKSNASDQMYNTLTGEQYDLSKGGAEITTQYANLGLSYKGLNARVIYDNFNTNTVDFYNYIFDPAFDVRFKSLLTDVNYEWNVNDNFTITPQVSFKNFTPWQTEDARYTYYHRAQRLSFKTNFKYSIPKKMNVTGGIEYDSDKSVLLDKAETPMYGYYNGDDHLIFSNIAAHAQGIFYTPFVNITVGARLDKHSAYNTAFSPRLGLTKVYRKFHAKLLYGRAFRAPGIENMNQAFLRPANLPPTLNAPEIKPETANSMEVEVGYKFTESLFARVNLFDMRIKDPIVYFVYYDNDGVFVDDGYYNAGKTGSSGVETDILYVRKWGSLNLSYSFYTSVGKNDVDVYGVYNSAGEPITETMLLGTPQHKLVLNSNFNVTKDFSINPVLMYKSGSYAYSSGVDGSGVENPPTLQDEIFILNLNLLYTNLFTKGLDFSISAHDLLNSKPELYPMFRGYHAPYPDRSREIMAKLVYSFSATKK